MTLSPLDLAIVLGYAVALIVIATLVSREKAGHTKDTQDYFLAGKALPWWAVGASLIAANISAEQIIGMTGLIFAALVAQPLLGGFPQAFQYIQEFTGFFTPGICAIFILGVFWKKATANGALLAALASFGLSIGGKLLLPSMPFMDRVGYVFLACCAIMAIDALIERKDQRNAVNLSDVDFKTSTGYWIGSGVVVAGLVALYGAFW